MKYKYGRPQEDSEEFEVPPEIPPEVPLVVVNPANQQHDLAALDIKLKSEFNRLKDQIRDRANELTQLKLEAMGGNLENVDFWKLNSVLIQSLERKVIELNRMNYYLYNHATNFCCLTRESTQRQAKLDVLQAYETIQTMINDPDYSLDQQQVDLFKIRSNFVRNLVITIVVGVVLLVTGFTAAVLGHNLLLTIFGNLEAVSAGVMVALSLCAAFLMTTGIGSLIIGGLTQASNLGAFDTFQKTFTEKTQGFFHKGVDKLFPGSIEKEPRVVEVFEDGSEGLNSGSNTDKKETVARNEI